MESTPPSPSPTPAPSHVPSTSVPDLSPTASQHGTGRLTNAYLASRRAYIAPLFDYCERRGLVTIRLARQAASPAGDRIGRGRLWRIKTGHCLVPDWFIAGICREIGEPIERVMGAEWAQKHLPASPPDLPSRSDGAPNQRLAS